MISVKIFDIKQFKCFFDVVADTESLILHFEQKGLNVNVLNKSHTCFYNVFYDSCFFDDYSVIDPVEFVVDSEEFNRVLGSGRKGDNLTIQFEDDLIHYIFDNTGKNKRVIKTPYIDDDYGDVPIAPEIHSQAEAVFDLTSFKDIIVDADKVVKVGKLRIGTVNSNLYFKSSNDDMMDYENVIYDSIVTGSDVSSEFTFEYLKELLKFKDIDNAITFKLGDDIPLVWDICSQDKLVKCGGLIAPRLENT